MDVAGNWWLVFEGVPFEPSPQATLEFDGNGAVRRPEPESVGSWTLDGDRLTISSDDDTLPAIVATARERNGQIISFHGTMRDGDLDEPIAIVRQQARGFWSVKGGASSLGDRI